MDPTKVSAVLNLPAPDSRKQLQRFLGLVNFFRRFIKNYSAVVAPLTALTSVQRLFLWTLETDAAFRILKERFTTAPILRILDPAVQFVVEVDASNIWVGAVLSQRATTDNQLTFPPTFLVASRFQRETMILGIASCSR